MLGVYAGSTQPCLQSSSHEAVAVFYIELHAVQSADDNHLVCPLYARHLG